MMVICLGKYLSDPFLSVTVSEVFSDLNLTYYIMAVLNKQNVCWNLGKESAGAPQFSNDTVPEN